MVTLEGSDARHFVLYVLHVFVAVSSWNCFGTQASIGVLQGRQRGTSDKKEQDQVRGKGRPQRSVIRSHKGVPRSKAARAAVSKGKSRYRIPFNQRTQRAEYMKAYRAAKEAEKLVQATKGSASIKSVTKGPKKVGPGTGIHLVNALTPVHHLTCAGRAVQCHMRYLV